MIEILMAAYNGEKYLREQIESIINQDETSWHLTISDDMSADSTREIIREYVRNYPEKISEHVSEKRFGNAKDHFLHLLENCDSDYIMFSDQDDVWDPDKVAVTYEEMKRQETDKEVPVLVFTDLTPVDSELKEIGHSLMEMQDQDPHHLDYRNLLFQNVVTGCTVMINKSLRDLSLRYENSDDIIMHDWWLGIVAAKFGRIAYLDRRTMKYRQHVDNSVGLKKVKSFDYVMEKLKSLRSVKETVLRKKRQAGQFMNTYSNLLTVPDFRFLESFAKRKSGIGFYSKYRNNIHGFFRFLGFVTLG